MDRIMGSLALSFMTGINCSLFFGTLLARKGKAEYLPAFTFTAGFLVISFTEAPGYLLQPLRVILILCVVTRIFYQAGIVKAFLLAAFWCAIYWTLNLLAVSAVYAMPPNYGTVPGISDCFCAVLFLFLSLFFRHRCKSWTEGWKETGLRRFVWLPMLSILVSTLLCITVWYTESLNKAGVVVAAAGYSTINILIFYFIGNILGKEAEIRRAQITQIRLQNQIELVENIQENDRRYRRYLHDYKNQLGCIQGMLKAGYTEEAIGYIEELGGSIRKGEDSVNTNHPVVNTVLNQKYLRAQEKGITLVMAVNDLSGLTMGREEIVTLLVNLLDNAIEACEKLDGNKIIQFKMMLEEGDLTLSVRNPVKEPAAVKGKRIRTSKENKECHGFGMLNINAVIEKNHGTSIVECRDGWFYFSAVIPVHYFT